HGDGAVARLRLDGEPARIHRGHVLGVDVDERDLVAGPGEGGAGHAADRARAPDREGHDGALGSTGRERASTAVQPVLTTRWSAPRRDARAAPPRAPPRLLE